MLISRKWLSQYMNLDDIDDATLADKITSAGNEVEGIEYLASGSKLVVGEVIKCEDHPDSDHLKVCQVNIGTETLQIVCGAPNCRKGLKVIVALDGCILPSAEIKKGIIRGVESNGMLCSLLELGVDSKSLTDYQKAGIEELGEDAVVGDHDVLAYLGLDDVILDVGLTPNRSDCLAAFSMAIEVGATLNKEVKLPEFKGAAEEGTESQLVVKSETEKCPLYSGKIIRNVKIGPSPKWIRQLLVSSGIKSINNVVDISNLVMLETGQPLHFFDLSKLDKEEIIVKDGLTTKYEALDGITYDIEPDDIMITVAGKPVAIAGVMGGEDSKIDDDTKGILIEAATFDHVSIRNTARRLNLNTDASIRYQKGIEPAAPYKAMDRAVQLLKKYADASSIEETKYSAQRKIKPLVINVDLDNINHHLGTEFSDDQMIEVLKRLRLDPVRTDREVQLTIPTYRQDLAIEEDISEEIIRLLGYDNLPSTLPEMPMTVGRLNKRQALRRNIRDILTNQGYYEAITYTLISDEDNDNRIMDTGKEKIQLASPMSEEHKIIRSSIIPSLLHSVAYNMARSIDNVPLFEISNVYAGDDSEERLAIALNGNLQESRWQNFAIVSSFYTMKGLIQAVLEKLGYNSTRVIFKENGSDKRHFHPYRSAEVYIGKDLLGVFGAIHPNMAKQYGVSDNCIIAELNLEVIINNKTSKTKYEEISRYPAISRDLALVVKENVKVGDIIRTIVKCGRKIITDVEVFDVYTGEHVADGYKSIAISVTFQSKERTLKDEEINSVYEKILIALKKEHDAELRA